MTEGALYENIQEKFWDDVDFDLATAAEALQEATDPLAGAWAALRHAGMDEESKPLVDILTVIRSLRKQVIEKREARRPKTRAPEDWYLQN